MALSGLLMLDDDWTVCHLFYFWIKGNIFVLLLEAVKCMGEVIKVGYRGTFMRKQLFIGIMCNL